MSWRYPQLKCVFELFWRKIRAMTPCKTISRAPQRLVRVNDAAMPLAHSAPFFRTRSDGDAIFTISKLRLRIAQLAVRVR